MKTPNEIKDEVAKSHGYESWEDLTEFLNVIGYKRFNQIENEAMGLYAQQFKEAGRLPTVQEIEEVLYKCAKITRESTGIKMERYFENEAKAMLSLFTSPLHR